MTKCMRCGCGSQPYKKFYVIGDVVLCEDCEYEARDTAKYYLETFKWRIPELHDRVEQELFKEEFIKYMADVRHIKIPSNWEFE